MNRFALNRVKLESVIIALLCFIIFLIIVLAVGFRDHYVGVDTKMYVMIFEEISQGIYTRFEPGFVLLTKLISLLTFNISVYFLVICSIVLGGYLLFYMKLINWQWGKRRNVDIVLILGLLLASSWFFTSVTNGLRQGMALPFAYLSLFLFFQKRYGWSFAFMVLSVGFHYSSLSLLPFFILVFFRGSWLYAVVIFSAFMYPLGFNELAVGALSTGLGLPAYEFIKYYGVDQGLWVGFQIDLFIYSIFWFLLFAAGERFIHVGHLERWRIVVRMYGILLMPYFILGFGGFSNRFALIAWFFLPAGQAAFILWSKFDARVKLVIGFLWFFVGVFYFASFFFESFSSIW